MNALTVEHLSVRYAGNVHPAVRDVSLTVQPREIRALVGESGSGKSTLGLAVQRLLPRSAALAGEVYVGGEPMIGVPREAARAIRGTKTRYVPQDPSASLNPSRTVAAQLGETLKLRGVRDRAERQRRVVQLLGDVGIPDPELCLTLYPHELSGGMAQRVIIADALLVDPAVIIADEPTASLDATTAVLILSLLRRLATEKGTGIVLITHNIAHAMAVGDSIAVMYSGVIVESGPVRTVLDEPRMPYTAALLQSRATIGRGRERLPVIPGSPGPNPNGPQACVFSARCRFADEQCAAAPAATVEAGVFAPDQPVQAARNYRCWHPIVGTVDPQLGAP
jgi:oligopeptide/dipeptide ABC transporter ATP-binding protein